MKWLLPMVIGVGIGIWWFMNKGEIDVYLSDAPEYMQTFKIREIIKEPREPENLFEFLLSRISVRVRL